MNLSKVKVVVVSNKKKSELEIGWKQMITGDSRKDIWARLLKSVNADRDEAAQREAVRQKWDVVCYAGTDGAPNEVARTQTAQNKDAANITSIEARQHFQQGIQYAAHRDYSNAGKEFSNAIRISPAYAAAYSNRGVVYMQQKKFDLAEDDLKKAVELGPADGKNHYNLACWFSLQGQVGRGLVSLDKALTAGFSDYQALRRDKDLSNLRKSADWQRTLDKHKIFLGR